MQHCKLCYPYININRFLNLLPPVLSRLTAGWLSVAQGRDGHKQHTPNSSSFLITLFYLCPHCSLFLCNKIIDDTNVWVFPGIATPRYSVFIVWCTTLHMSSDAVLHLLDMTIYMFFFKSPFLLLLF